MRKILTITLLFLCLNAIAEGQFENDNFEIVYEESIINKNMTIYILRCNITEDLFLLVKSQGNGVPCIAIAKIDSKYSELIRSRINREK